MLGRRQSEAAVCVFKNETVFWKPFPLLCAAKEALKGEVKLQKLFISFSKVQAHKQGFPRCWKKRSTTSDKFKPSALQKKSSNSLSNLPSCSKAVPQLHIQKNILSVDMKMHTVTELQWPGWCVYRFGNRQIHMSTQTNLRSSQFLSTFYLTWS